MTQGVHIMKKILSVLLAAALCISIASCSKEVTDNDISRSESASDTLAETVHTQTEPAAVTVTSPEETAENTSSEKKDTVLTEDKTSDTEKTVPQTSPKAEVTPGATEAPVPGWTETAVSGIMYVSTDGIYSRVNAIQGSTRVKRYSLNQAVNVVAKTDTGYYKLENGAFIHADYLSSSKITLTTTTTTVGSSAAATTPAPPAATTQNPPSLPEFAARVFELTNQERIKNGKKPFEAMIVLNDIADTRVGEIAIKYGHTRPDGQKFSTAFNDKGIVYGYFGENIAAGQSTPEAVVAAWMNSEGHRKNILSDTYTHLGVGYCFKASDPKNYNHYWVQNFYAY